MTERTVRRNGLCDGTACVTLTLRAAIGRPRKPPSLLGGRDLIVRQSSRTRPWACTDSGRGWLRSNLVWEVMW